MSNSIFWELFRKIVQRVPCENQPLSKTQNRDVSRLNDIFRQNKYFPDFFYRIWYQKIATAKYKNFYVTP